MKPKKPLEYRFVVMGDQWDDTPRGNVTVIKNGKGATINNIKQDKIYTR